MTRKQILDLLREFNRQGGTVARHPADATGEPKGKWQYWRKNRMLDPRLDKKGRVSGVNNEVKK